MADLGFTLKKTVVLVGMMGAGKSAVGRSLAEFLQVPFLDSDEELVRAANMPISEIFERDGEPFFRAREAEIIARLLEEKKGILSTGGGAYLNPANRAVISRAGVAVWLDADIDLLWSRVRHKDTRPLLRTSNPRATLEEIFKARVPEYSKADLTVTGDPAFSIGDMTQEVVKSLLTRPDVLEANK